MMTEESTRTLRRTMAGQRVAVEDAAARSTYVPTGGFIQATGGLRLYRAYDVGRYEGHTADVIAQIGLPYGYAPARTPIYANRPWEDALLPPRD